MNLLRLLIWFTFSVPPCLSIDFRLWEEKQRPPLHWTNFSDPFLCKLCSSNQENKQTEARLWECPTALLLTWLLLHEWQVILWTKHNTHKKTERQRYGGRETGRQKDRHTKTQTQTRAQRQVGWSYEGSPERLVREALPGSQWISLRGQCKECLCI